MATLHLAFSEIGKSASRSVSSSKFYFRMTVAWLLCLRHNISRKEQGIFLKSIMLMFLKNEDCVTLPLGKLWKWHKWWKWHSITYLCIYTQSAFCTNIVCSLRFVPSLQFVHGLQSAFCTFVFPNWAYMLREMNFSRFSKWNQSPWAAR